MAKKTTKPEGTTLDKVLSNMEATMLSLSTKKDADSVASLTRIARAHAQVRAEKRKAEKEDRRASEQITHAAVIAWLKALPPAERSEIVRTAIAMDEKRSGLA